MINLKTVIRTLYRERRAESKPIHKTGPVGLTQSETKKSPHSFPSSQNVKNMGEVWTLLGFMNNFHVYTELRGRSHTMLPGL